MATQTLKNEFPPHDRVSPYGGPGWTIFAYDLPGGYEANRCVDVHLPDRFYVIPPNERSHAITKEVFKALLVVSGRMK